MGAGLDHWRTFTAQSRDALAVGPDHDEVLVCADHSFDLDALLGECEPAERVADHSDVNIARRRS